MVTSVHPNEQMFKRWRLADVVEGADEKRST